MTWRAAAGIGLEDLEGPRQEDGSLRVHCLQGPITVVIHLLSDICGFSAPPSLALCV